MCVCVCGCVATAAVWTNSLLSKLTMQLHSLCYPESHNLATSTLILAWIQWPAVELSLELMQSSISLTGKWWKATKRIFSCPGSVLKYIQFIYAMTNILLNMAFLLCKVLETLKKGLEAHLHFRPHWVVLDLWITGLVPCPPLQFVFGWPSKAQCSSRC